MKKIIFIYLLFSTILGTVYAQRDSLPYNHKYYFWLGCGSGTLFNDPGIMTAKLSLNSSFRQKYFIKFIGEESDESSFSWDPKPPNRLVHNENYAALIGIGKYQFNALAFITYTGISYGKETYRGNILSYESSSGVLYGSSSSYPVYDYQEYHYIGFPVEVTILFTSPFLGLSIDAYANFHKHSEYGLVVSTCLGRIRNKHTK